MLKFLAKSSVIGLFICGVALPVMAQQNRAALDDAIGGFESTTHQRFQGVRDDWSDHHVVYSRPEPGSDAEYKAQHDARYWLQQIKHNLTASQFEPPVPYGTRVNRQKPGSTLKKDWTATLGTNATAGAGVFPAKFSFAPVGAPVCTGTNSDYVVFNTSVAGSLAAKGTGTFANVTSFATQTVLINGQTFTATGVGIDTFSTAPVAGATTVVDGVTYNWTAATCNAFTPTATSACVVVSATTSTDATNLEEAITNACGAVTNCKVSGANPGASAFASAATVAVINTTVSTNIAWSLTGTSGQALTPTGTISFPSNSSTTFALNTGSTLSVTTSAANLATAINDNPATSVVATSSAGVVTVNAITGGTSGNSITTTETLAGFSWGGATLASGTNGQASILAFNNLYATTCNTGTVPEVFWAYSTGGRVITSPTLSLDGTQVAFAQDTGAGTAASLVLLKWAQNPTAATSGANGHTTLNSATITTTASFFQTGYIGAKITGTGIPANATIIAVGSGISATISAPATSTNTTDTFAVAAETAAAPGIPVSVPASSYHTCTAPCMTTLPFNTASTGTTHSDTLSATYYDTSGTDTIFVADDVNYLHQFNNVFTSASTPAELVTSPWPVHAGTTAAPLNSPVYDSNDNLVFIGDGHLSGGTVDGEVHSVNATTGAVVSTATICHGVGFGYTDSFLIDPVAGEFYTFCSEDDQITGANACTTAVCVRQFPVNFTAASQGTPATLGAQVDAFMYTGAFDEQYFASSATSPTGHLYACGNPNGDPTLYQMPITAGVMGASSAVAVVGSTSGSQCSPVTEVYNPSLTNSPFDFLFLSVQAGGAATGCSGGCVMNFIATQWTASNPYTLNQEILDTNFDIQKVTTAGTSKSGTHPTWNATLHGTTSDGGVTWTNEGTMLANSVGASEAGGTSAISVDNVSGLTGASQIYFTTITPATSLAVQASQASP